MVMPISAAACSLKAMNWRNVWRSRASAANSSGLGEASSSKTSRDATATGLDTQSSPAAAPPPKKTRESPLVNIAHRRRATFLGRLQKYHYVLMLMRDVLMLSGAQKFSCRLDAPLVAKLQRVTRGAANPASGSVSGYSFRGERAAHALVARNLLVMGDYRGKVGEAARKRRGAPAHHRKGVSVEDRTRVAEKERALLEMNLHNRETLAHERQPRVANRLQRGVVGRRGVALRHEHRKEGRMHVAGKEAKPAVDLGLLAQPLAAREPRRRIGARQVAQDRRGLRENPALAGIERRDGARRIDLQELGRAGLDGLSLVGSADPFENDVDAERTGAGSIIELHLRDPRAGASNGQRGTAPPSGH